MKYLWFWLIAVASLVVSCGGEPENVPYSLSIKFPDVNGLAIGANIQHEGNRIGEVTNMTLNQNCVLVDAKIEGDVLIPRGSVFKIDVIDLMGERCVDVQFSNQSVYCKDTDVVKGEGIETTESFDAVMEGLSRE